MSDEKIINFKDMKDKVKPSDVDKFDEYIYSLFGEVASGNISMFEFTSRITKYMEENNISKEKFIELEKQMLQRYGFDIDNIEEEMKKLQNENSQEKISNFVKEWEGMDNNSVARRLGFYDYYAKQLKETNVLELNVKNEKNDVRILLDKNKITLISEKKIDLSDSEINQIITYYRGTMNEPLKVLICEATNQYDYY